MENVSQALIMAFSVLVFVIALSVSMYALTNVNTTAKSIVYMSDKTNYYDNLSVTASDRTSRVVDSDTIIPTLYRYYKENFSVKIYDETSGTKELMQIFDIDTEGKIYRASAMTSAQLTSSANREYKLLMEVYGDVSRNPYPYLFQAPWIGNTQVDTKTRIDLYVNRSSRLH
jgi:hypothetical protein